MDVNEDNLGKALSSNDTNEVPESEKPQMPKEMEIGYHQGALNTLASERIELIKIIQNVEKIIGMHIKRLEELGVKVQKKTE